MQTAKLVLEYLKVFLSVQMVAGATIIVFLCIFRVAIQKFIDRIKNIGFGNASVSTSQVVNSAGHAAELEAKPKPPVEVNKEVKLPEGVHLTPEQIEKIKELVNAERATARLWEYRYLGFYLAQTTQLVLDELVGLKQRTTLHLLDARLQPFVTDAEERRAIINALQTHHLIQIDANLIDVTEKGKEYVAWRGPAVKLAA